MNCSSQVRKSSSPKMARATAERSIVAVTAQHTGAQARDDGVAHPGRPVQVVHHGIRIEHGAPVPGERRERR